MPLGETMGKHKYKHHKMNPLRSVVKKVAGASGTVVMVLPALVPVMTFGTRIAGGTSITNAVDAATGTIGFSTGGTVDMGKIVKYGIFTVACVVIGKGLKYAVKSA